MKHITILTLVILFTLFSQTSLALCGMSAIENASYCETRVDTVWCVVEEASCIEAWCYTQDECEWELVIPKTCS